MIYQKIEYTAEELNTASPVFKNINVNYLGASSIRVKNNSGADISFLAFSIQDKKKYDLDSGITDFITVSDNEIETITDVSPEVRYAVITGTEGHDASVYFEILKDEN